MALEFKDDLSGKDVLLVIAPPAFPRMPMLGPAYLMTHLKHNGCSPSLLDLSVLLFNQATEAQAKLWLPDCINTFFVTEIASRIYNNFKKEINAFVDWVIASDVRIIAFSVNQSSIFLANKIAEDIKKRDWGRTIIFGGPGTYFKDSRDEITPGFVDFFVIGEGEAVFLSLVQRLSKGEPVGRERGLLLGQDLGVIAPEPAALVADIDDLSFPTFEEFDLAAYNQGSDYKPLPLLLSRGCINRCSYCIDHIMWPHYRVRSSEHVFKEIEYHTLVNHVRDFELSDLLCNGNLKNLEALCDLLIVSNLNVSWMSYAVIRSGMTPMIFKKMKQSGCHSIAFGLEHVVPRILKEMNKHYTQLQAEQVVRMSHEAGIKTNINIIVGFPGETMKDVDEVVVFLRRNKDYIHQVTNISGFTLFPESEIGQHRSRYGVVLKEGDDPMLFKDARGLDRKGRLDRVDYLCRAVQEMGLGQGLVNRPKLNPMVLQRTLGGNRC